MGLRDIGTARPDGYVRYRVDVTGARVGVLPARCKQGLHSLHTTGYTAIETGRELHLSCTACASVPHPDHSWRLVTSGQPPDRAELDDAAYIDVVPHLVQPKPLSP